MGSGAHNTAPRQEQESGETVERDAKQEAEHRLLEVLETEDPTRRLDELTAIVSEHPGADVPHYWLAVECARRGESVEAKKELRECLRINPAFSHAHLRLAEILLAEESWELAAEQIEAGIASGGDEGVVGELRALAVIVNAARRTAAQEISPEELRVFVDRLGLPEREGPEPVDADGPSESTRSSGLLVVDAVRTTVSRRVPMTREHRLLEASLYVLDILEGTGGGVRAPLARLALDLLFHAYRDDPGRLEAFALAFGGWEAVLPREPAREVTQAVERVPGGGSSRPADAWVLEPRQHPAAGAWAVEELGPGPVHELDVQGNTLLMTNVQAHQYNVNYGRTFQGEIHDTTARIEGRFQVADQAHHFVSQVTFSADFSMATCSTDHTVSVRGFTHTSHQTRTWRKLE